MLRRLDTPLLPLAATVVAYLFLILSLLGQHDGDPSWFVVAGDAFADPAQVPPNLTVRPDSYGYDGQFYYRLALDPLTDRRIDFGIILDKPAVRQQRILYPLFVWAFSLAGRAGLVPTVMIALNFAALCAIAWTGGLLAQSLGRHAAWGVVFPLWAGFVFTVARDLTEAVAIACLLAGLVLWHRGRTGWAAFAFTLAVLARETTLLVPAAALVVALIDSVRRRRWEPKALVWLVPIAAFALWQMALFGRWGQVAFVQIQGTGLPFVGLVDFLRTTEALQTPSQQRWFVDLCFLFALAAAGVYALFSTTANRAERLAWVLYGGLATMLNRAVWVEDIAFLRATTEFYILGAVILLGSRSRVRIPVFIWAAILWALTLQAILQGI